MEMLSRCGKKRLQPLYEPRSVGVLCKRGFKKKSSFEDVEAYLPRAFDNLKNSQSGSKSRDAENDGFQRKKKKGNRKSWRDDEAISGLTAAPGLEFIGTPHAVSAALALERASQLGNSISTRLVSRTSLDRRLENHRGVILECAPVDLTETTAGDRRWKLGDSDAKDTNRRRTALILDRIVDPQNLGAVLRTSYFLGVDHILVSKKKSAPLSETVARVSCGALEFLAASRRLMAINGSTSDFLRGIAEKGWQVVATEVPSKATMTPADLRNYSAAALVLGSEATGLRPDVLEACLGGSVTIAPGPGDPDLQIVDSLNVSAAAAILIHELVASK